MYLLSFNSNILNDMHPGNSKCLSHIYNLKMPKVMLVSNPLVNFSSVWLFIQWSILCTSTQTPHWREKNSLHVILQALPSCFWFCTIYFILFNSFLVSIYLVGTVCNVKCDMDEENPCYFDGRSLSLMSVCHFILLLSFSTSFSNFYLKSCIQYF